MTLVILSKVIDGYFSPTKSVNTITMRKLLLGILLLTIVGCSYKLRFVDVKTVAPSQLLSEKLNEDENYYVVAHYISDSTNYHVRLSDIKITKDHVILAKTSPYDTKSDEAKFFHEANKRLIEGKNKVERSTRPSNAELAQQVHLYIYESDSTYVGNKLKISDEEINVVRDLSFHERPPSYVLFIIVGGFAGVALILWLIWYAFFRPIGNAVNEVQEGCYVATMVYGSYDAPEVMALRRFRDNRLKKSRLGRSFIKWYYKYSPKFVQRHQNKPRLRRLIKWGLDVFIRRLP